MLTKEQIRKIYYKTRKKKYFEIDQNFFKPLINLLKKLQRKKVVLLSLYYPTNYEVNTLKIKKLLEGKKYISTGWVEGMIKEIVEELVEDVEDIKDLKEVMKSYGFPVSSKRKISFTRAGLMTHMKVTGHSHESVVV